MGRKCQLVMGPAGSGKSTYCATMMTHCQNIGRNVHLVNLDPAAEHFEYEPSIDVKDLITLEDVMEELGYGPNGGLIYCMEFLINNIEWFEEELGSWEDDYLIIDCPGQIELYTHFPIMRTLLSHLHRLNFQVCGVYLLDSQFLSDSTKFLSGSLSAMSAMIQLELPHVNVLSKMDLIKDQVGTAKGKRELEKFLWVDTSILVDDGINGKGTNMVPRKMKGLTEAIAQLLDDYDMVSYLPLDISDEDSIATVLYQIDQAIQFGEDAEPREPDDIHEVDEAIEEGREYFGEA
ncbi:GPN-loop GTPase [Paraphysoderma sedebokerense]|nr:GPN-loop GTPase [Paraphysoderma sedebokerense]